MKLRRPNLPEKLRRPNLPEGLPNKTTHTTFFKPVPRPNRNPLSREEFLRKGPYGIMTPNNFWLHFCHLPEAIPNYRDKLFVKYLEKNYPELLKELTEKITQAVQKTKTIETSKIYEMFGDKLYEAYCIGIRAGFTNEELFR